MKQVLIVLTLMLTFTVTSCKDDSQSDVKLVSPEEMQTLLELEDVQLIDVRTPEEFKEGNIPTAQNIDYNSPTFDEDITKLDKTKPVILYCKSGGRSAKCAKKMEEAGFVKVYDLDGGISKWQHEGYEVEIKS
ncbi:MULTISPECIES: rhodanese-like domain-containing protein [Flavobacteriaceae]|uniref:Rhodanese-related sulfurtransferase n=1 Tax=Meridianimaribacter flavus TaxID=571115 RepID=A0ABY2GA32_9FLAO|nr:MULTISPECIES: rhodanese-like domain-containing protein [Flavobacteriaceae]RYH75543.1 rhodanese-like domain-containing protein [Flavobacteriaceae bacterium 144Ye]TBV27659.1 rhodanese-like domain-containing protein [Meridianimaribacter sp. CL38]TDY14203.1 rhodanese-related sulfurtransferase [Meridianimaribacter flavus]